MSLSSIRAYLRLCRIEYWGFGYVALLGAFAQGGLVLAGGQVAALLVANVLFVAWTFAHNDFCDLELDRKADALDERVLVRGDLSPMQAVKLVSTLIALMLTISFTQLGLGPTLGFAAASVLAMSYDAISKRVLGSDLLFGASAACLALAGALAVGSWGSVSDLAKCAIAIVFVEHLFFNAIEGGLKDVMSDRRAGAITFAQRFIRVVGDRIEVSHTFVATAFGLKVTSIALALYGTSLATQSPLLPIALIALLGVIALFFSARFILRREYDWPAMAKDLMPIEMASRLFVPVMLVQAIGWGVVALLFFIPAFWYVTLAKLVHARGMELPKRF